MRLLHATEESVVTGDHHFPHHSKPAYRWLLDELSARRPSRLLLNGDILDMYSVSRHPKDPRTFRLLMHELDGARGYFQGFREACGLDTEIVWIKGNHEDRLDRYLVDVAPALTEYVPSLETYLKLADLGISTLPYTDGVMVGDVLVTHDTGNSGKYVAQRSLEAAGTSVVVGHAHRLQVTFDGSIYGGGQVGACSGWLGDPDSHVFNYARPHTRRSWTHGFISIARNGEDSQISPVRCTVS